VTYDGYGTARRSSRWRLPGSQRTWIIVIVAAALVVILLETHRLDRFEIIYFCVLIPSIILHEISHGVVALAFGDDTAKRAGRLSLNPIRHVDPVGTLLVPAILTLSGIGAYGWAKPVPVNPNRLRSPRNQMVVVSMAGPLTNFLLAAACAVVFIVITPAGIRQIVAVGGYFPPTLLEQIVFIGGVANLVLGAFNLIPCPPLDGSAVLERMIPARSLPGYYRIRPLLMFLPLVVILLFYSEWAYLIDHLFNWWASLLG